MTLTYSQKRGLRSGHLPLSLSFLPVQEWWALCEAPSGMQWLLTKWAWLATTPHPHWQNLHLVWVPTCLQTGNVLGC